MADTVVIAEQGEESTGYRFSWGLAIMGGVVATAVTFFLLTLGSGFGLLLTHPNLHAVPSFLTGGAIYFMIAQAFGFAVGGHFTGRLIGRLPESKVQEEFRAEAHGLVAWAVAVLATVAMVAIAAISVNVGSGTAALYGMSTQKAESAPTAYLVDVLFRPNTNAPEGARAEAARILDAGLARGEQIAPDDKDRLMTIVANEANMTRDAAAVRIDNLQRDVQAKTKKAADIARKVASYTSLWIAISLLFGALVSMMAAVMAREEDDRDALNP
ncbi:MAG TPA: hypothetical protein VHE09_01640 [Rhizomicrobium sp.]|nr:hypothetical protein [Rhizomicrobium sp.]